MKLVSHYSLFYTVDAKQPELLDLKPLITPWTSGQRLRRVDRYIELCVAGGLNCVNGRPLAADTGVYLSTRCGAVTTSARVMETIVGNRDMPKPLHFINTLGNSACFYLTQLLHTTGNTLVISQEHLSFEAALVHAWLDLQQGRVSRALVGGIDEVALPLELHSQRLEVDYANAQNFSEGSHWLLLEPVNSDAGNEPQLTLGQPEYFSDLSHLHIWLTQQMPTQIQCCFTPTAEESQHLSSVVALQPFTPANIGHGVFSGAALLHLSEIINTTGGHGIHLARDGEGGYCVVSLKRV
jgi:hypothetical protein